MFGVNDLEVNLSCGYYGDLFIGEAGLLVYIKLGEGSGIC